MAEASAAHPGDELARLLVATSAGDRAAFERLYLETSAKLFGVVRRILSDRAQAEEVLQEVYVRIWQSAHSFDATRGAPLGWMVALARYRAIDIVRRNATRDATARPGDAAWQQPDTATGLDFTDSETLRQCLEELAEEQRRCVVLAYCDGYSRDELAQRFDRPVGTIKSWLSRCLAALRGCLERHD